MNRTCGNASTYLLEIKLSAKFEIDRIILIFQNGFKTNKYPLDENRFSAILKNPIMHRRITDNKNYKKIIPVLLARA